MLSNAEINKRVYDKFPVSKSERKCEQEKRDMDRLRTSFRKKLIEQGKEKKEYK